MNAVMKRLTGTALANAGQQAKAHIDAAERHRGKTEEQYKAAGSYLIQAKAAVKHGQWLKWLGKYGIAERTAQFCMQVYGGPEALEKKREGVRKAHAKAKAPSKADLKDTNPPLTEQPCDDCNNDEERWQRSCGMMLGEMLALRPYWRRAFGKWEEFKVPKSLVTLARQAADELKQLADQLSNPQS